MKIILFAVFVGCLQSLCLSATPSSAPIEPRPRGDQHTFTVRAVAPTVPAMKYRLTLDPAEIRSGDAAALYLQAVLLLPTDSDDVVDASLDAHEAGQSLASDPKVKLLLAESRPVFNLLDLATRRDRCEWNSPVLDLRIETMLPQLNRMRQLANLLRVRGLWEIDSGNYIAAARTVQMEYTLGRHTAQGMPLIGGLVGLGIASVGDSLVKEMISRPDCPNLYWPLINLPNPIISFRDTMDGEAQWSLAQIPVLKKARSGNITAEDWPSYARQSVILEMALQAHEKFYDSANVSEGQIAISTAAMGLAAMPAAKKYYADTRHITVDQAGKLDSQLLLATYFLERYQIAADEQAKLLGLPLHELIARSESLPARMKALGVSDNNLIAMAIPATAKLPLSFGRNQRTTAALVAVEAVRAYAADHAGKLPVKLEDVTETPIPANPMTGKSFDFRVDGNTAVISDTNSPGSDKDKGFPLIYMLKVQKS